MFLSSSRRAVLSAVSRRSSTATRSYASSTATATVTSSRQSMVAAVGAAGLLVAAYTATSLQQQQQQQESSKAWCAGIVAEIGKVTKEPATGISFPELCNGMTLAGVGVRIKYVFVKVYGVGAYFDPIAMMAVKKGGAKDIEQALLDPTYPRTLRIVMNRGLSTDKFIAAIVEAVEPRLKGKHLETLEEFKGIFTPGVDLVEGDEIDMTIRGETLLLKTALGVGTIKSRPFTEAMCDVYFGEEPVSPTLKEEVMKGIPKM
ncbi:MAG: hypothetical protein SGILL_002800 [Bacillariaceae sp.]